MTNILNPKQLGSRINLQGTLNSKKSTIGEIGNKGTNIFYDNLRDKPQINNITLSGNQTSKDLKLQDAMDALSNIEIQKIWKDGKL